MILSLYFKILLTTLSNYGKIGLIIHEVQSMNNKFNRFINISKQVLTTIAGLILIATVLFTLVFHIIKADFNIYIEFSKSLGLILLPFINLLTCFSLKTEKRAKVILFVIVIFELLVVSSSTFFPFSFPSQSITLNSDNMFVFSNKLIKLSTAFPKGIPLFVYYILNCVAEIVGTIIQLACFFASFASDVSDNSDKESTK